MKEMMTVASHAKDSLPNKGQYLLESATKFVRTPSLFLSVLVCLRPRQPWPVALCPSGRSIHQDSNTITPLTSSKRFPFLYVFLILYGSHVSCAVGTHLTWLGMSDGEGRYQIRRETLERGFDIWNVNPPLFCLLPVPLAHMGDYFPFK